MREHHPIYMESEYLLDDRQHPRLCVVVSVSPNTQVDLHLKAILSVRTHQAKERIFGCLWHSLRREDSRIGACHVCSDSCKSVDGFC